MDRHTLCYHRYLYHRDCNRRSYSTMITLQSVVLVVLSSIIGAFGPVFLKKASGDFSFNIIKQIRNVPLIIGMACYGLSVLIYIPALKGGELSVIYPLVSISYVLAALYSVWLLKERMTLQKWAGIALIMFGIALIGIAA